MSDTPKPIDDVRSDMADALDRNLARIAEAGTMRKISPNGEVVTIDLEPSMWGVIARRVKDLNLVPSELRGTNAEKLKRASEKRNIRLADYEQLPDPGTEPDLATGT